MMAVVLEPIIHERRDTAFWYRRQGTRVALCFVIRSRSRPHSVTHRRPNGCDCTVKGVRPAASKIGIASKIWRRMAICSIIRSPCGFACRVSSKTCCREVECGGGFRMDRVPHWCHPADGDRLPARLLVALGFGAADLPRNRWVWRNEFWIRGTISFW